MEGAIRYRCLLLAVLFAIPAHAQTTRFAWLSDTHVGGSTGADDLRRAVQTINRTDSLDFVILSGDITESGTNAQLREAFGLLDSLRVPYHIIPGNHDTKWSESGGTMFRRLWGDDRFVFSKGNLLFVGLHQGPRMRMGDGHWAPEDIRWLDTVLRRDMTPQRRLLFITHYPLDSSITNWYEVLDRLKQVNTLAILHGHGHRNRLTSYEGIPGIMSRSNLSGRGGSTGFSVVAVDGDSLRVSEMRVNQDPPTVWAAVGMERQPDSPAVAYRRPSLSSESGGTGPRTVWRRNTGYTICAPPAVDGRRVIVCDGSGTVRALALGNGRELWAFASGGPVWGAPALAENRVVFGSVDGAVYCLDARTGRRQWKVQTGAPVVSAPAVAGGVVYVGGSDSTFRAIGLATGKQIWTFRGLTGYVEAKPLLAGDKVIFGAWDTYLYALERMTGTLVWKWQGDRAGTLYSPAACWPVASHGRVHVVAPDRMMTAIDIASGRTVWRSARHEVRETIGASSEGDLLFVRTMRDTLLAVDPSQDTLWSAWITHAGFGYDINSAMIAERGGTLFYGTKDGLLLALDAKSGAVRWRQRVAIGLLQTVAPIDRRSVVWTSLDGSVGLTQERLPAEKVPERP